MSSERAQQITAAVEQLPDRQRLGLHALPHRRADARAKSARRSGLSEATVRVHLFRAVRKLRKLLERPRASRRADIAARSGDVSRMKRAHLSDDRLIEICLADPLAPLDEPHLRTCERCEQPPRRAGLDARRCRPRASIDEADAAFPAERLARQHARILQRVDQLGRPARVIASRPDARQEPARPAARRARRWIAGDRRSRRRVPRRHRHRASGASAPRWTAVAETRMAVARRRRAAVTRTVVASLSDDELLGQIELAVGSAGPAALAAARRTHAPRLGRVR